MPLRGAHFGSQACQGMKPCVSYPEQVPRSDLPTGGRISFFLKAWEKITSDVWTRSVVRSGYRIQLRVLPRLFLSPPRWCTRMPQDPVKLEILRDEVKSLLQKRAIEEVTKDHPRRGFFSRIFLVQKRSGGLASSNRSSSSEPICSLSSFQNGDIEFNQTSTSERRLGYFPRFEGCIFSHLRPSSITTLSSVHFRRENVPVSSSAIWPLCKSICVHSSLEISFKSCSSPRYSSTCIPGRLVTTFSVRGPIMASQQKAPQDYSRSRLYSQLGEVRTSSSSGIHFPRCSIQAQTSINRPLSGQH